MTLEQAMAGWNTTMPISRTPIHASYLLYLSTFSEIAGRLYFEMAMKLSQLFRVQPSFLLHPTDFLGEEDVPEMAYFPAMNKPAEWKRDRMVHFLKRLKHHFNIEPMGEFTLGLTQQDKPHHSDEQSHESPRHPARI